MAHVQTVLSDLKDIRVVEREDDRSIYLMLGYTTGVEIPSWMASDGTMRFLVITLIAYLPYDGELYLLEEPENGIHPARIPAILELLHDIAADSREPIGPENPLRQVIVNTHSPTVFQQVPDDSVLFVKAVEAMDGTEQFFKKAHFCCLPDTWRARVGDESNVVARGALLPYLNPVLPKDRLEEIAVQGKRRVVDREDAQQLLLSSAW